MVYSNTLDSLVFKLVEMNYLVVTGQIDSVLSACKDAG